MIHSGRFSIILNQEKLPKLRWKSSELQTKFNEWLWIVTKRPGFDPILNSRVSWRWSRVRHILQICRGAVPPPCGRDDAAQSHLGTKRAAVLHNMAAAEEERWQDPVKTDMRMYSMPKSSTASAWLLHEGVSELLPERLSQPQAKFGRQNLRQNRRGMLEEERIYALKG